MRPFPRFVFLTMSLLLALASGCSRVSPVAGVWTGAIKAPASVPAPLSGLLGALGPTGTCVLTLRPDGTGFAKISVAPERPIAWTEEDGKVILRERGGAKRDAATPDPSLLVGTLSQDRRSLTLDLGVARVTLGKQPEGN